MRPLLRPSCIQQTLPTLRLPRRIVTTSATNAAPIDLPKLIVSPGSIHHNSLPSFLEYATRANLAPSRTVYVGTHYEYVSALSLRRLGFSLLRTGRKHDAGIDLIGHWILPPLREPLPVIVQCKARKISCNPSHIRELEGSFQGIPAEWRKKDVLGLLATTQNASRGVLQALGMSRWPLGFMKISRSGTIKQFIWNRAASERGLEGVGVTLRHTPRALLLGVTEQDEEEDGCTRRGKSKEKVAEQFQSAGTMKDIQLTWMGSPIFPDREGLDEETVKLMGVIVGAEEQFITRTPRKATKSQKRAAVTKVVKKNRSKVARKAATAAATKAAPTSAKKKGRPPGSKNKTTLLAVAVEAPKKRGRPKGSKNKVKTIVEEG
ncbi:hypothetical protein BU26DRAFT_490097 [Trematosphaeria pertusa]|uniref:Restriction endonuclease type IV Mrr domain-containing protein n=1 Tax=Trematosphaeria pertusa TaxID=390896 RepID=A0A6A6I611_9PLEO|nr:uncharacterized protein BU26DRAFT_490097 [Trematosphaeria pertusa]KAF2245757.1 hypothetical protein BU26DRAFT_490097 [Trematosphaeria pertusa]